MAERAHAFGGLWSARGAAVEAAAAQIVFIDPPGPTITALIRIPHAGPARRLAWVIPVPGKPEVAPSSNVIFERLERATAPEYWVEVAVEGDCKAGDEPDADYDMGYEEEPPPGLGEPGAAPIVVSDDGSVGALEYVTLEVDPTLDDPAQAATDWLEENGYDLTGLEPEVLRPYLEDGFNLLAFKLTSGAEAGAIGPVMLTYESELPIIPLRPAALAAQDDMPIQVWVFGPSQAVPANYKSLVINDALLDWLSGRKFAAGTLPAGGAGPFGPAPLAPSNYDAVVTAAADEAGGQGFVTELAGPASQFRDKIWSLADDENFTLLSTESYADGLDLIVAAHAFYGGWDGFGEAVAGATTLPDGVTLEEFGRDPERYRGMVEVDAAAFLQLLHDEALAPVAAAAAMLDGTPYLTRLYSTISPDEMESDPAFDYNLDLAQISNVHVAKQSIRCSPTRSRSDAPWRMALPQGGVVTGKGGEGWPLALDSLPANLKVVMLGTRGSGEVLEDNSERIGAALFDASGESALSALRAPQTGLLIGGTQTVRLPDGPDAAQDDAPPGSASDGCGVASIGAETSGSRARWWALAAALFLGLRRRYRRAAPPHARGARSS